MAAKSRMLKFKSGRSGFQNFVGAMILAMFTCFLLSVVPTQWFAAAVGYDRGLGEPLWIGKTFAVYMPTDWIEWAWRFSDYAPIKAATDRMVYMGMGAAFVGMASAFFYAYLLGKPKTGMDELHGSAHWAVSEEVDKTGFMPGKKHKVDGAMVGSVMIDKHGEVIHPMHLAFDRRYRRQMGWSRLGIPSRLGWCDKEGKTNLPDWVVSVLGGEHLRDKDGVPRFRLNKSVAKMVKLLQANDPTHILAFAPTRSGKGVGLVLPTLFTWRHSVLINDIKGENWALTSGFRRSAGQVVMKFEPACLDGSTVKWNPLDEIRKFTEQDVQDAQGMLMMVCDPKGEGLEDHWAKTSWEFLTGLALHLAYVGNGAGTLAGMASYLGDPRWDEERQMYLQMMQTEHDPEGKAGWTDTEGNPTRIHPAVANAAKTMLNKEERERGSVLSTAKSFLSLYLDPVVAKNTSHSDFLVRDLMNSDKPVSCYFVVQPADLERMVPLSRLFYAMVIRRNASDMHFAGGTSVQGYKHRLLLLIDELPALKKLSVLQEGLGYIAGYGLKCFLICQDLIQLEDAYGDKQTIMAGCRTRIAYAPNTQETADKLAAMTGKTTVHEESVSSSRSAWGMTSPNVSTSLNKTERELMTAAEFMAMNPDDMVLFVAGIAPIFGRKIKYYEDPEMSRRSRMPAPEKSDVIRIPGVTTVGRGGVNEKAGQASMSVTSGAQEDAAMKNRAKWAATMEATLKGSAQENAAGKGLTVPPQGKDGHSPSGKKQSFYSGHQVTEMTEADREKIRAIVEDSGVVDKVATISVF